MAAMTSSNHVMTKTNTKTISLCGRSFGGADQKSAAWRGGHSTPLQYVRQHSTFLVVRGYGVEFTEPLSDAIVVPDPVLNDERSIRTKTMYCGTLA